MSPEVTAAKKHISERIMREEGVSAVGTGRDENGREAVIVHLDPNVPNVRERISDIVRQLAGEVPVGYVEDGPFRKFPAT